MTWWNFYFQLHPGAIREDQVIEFLKALLRHIPSDILILWDRLPSHRSRKVLDFIAAQKGRLEHEFLPAYAPELNPVEYLWAYFKQHVVANFCPADFHNLSSEVRRRLRCLRRRKTLVTAFWIQAELF